MIDDHPVDTPWSKTSDEINRTLQTNSATGLTSEDARKRLRVFGRNQLTTTGQHSALHLFLSQFADWMVGLLIVAGIISGIVGDLSDTVLIVLIVLGNAVIGFAQEWKAERAIEALKGLAEPHVQVTRDGKTSTVAAVDLVPGDLIHVRAGDAVPADCRIVTAVEAEVDEAPLTGESLAVEKKSDPVAADSALPDRQSMIFSGTSVTRGRLDAIVTCTGNSSEVGRIAGMIAAATPGPTPLQQRLNQLSRQLAVIVLVACGIIFAAGILREPFERWNSKLAADMLLTAVSLAVAAIPEGLPAIVTVVLALGSQRMVARNAIVRRLSAVETLGSVNVICSDKTGTLTQNLMTVVDIIPAESLPSSSDSSTSGDPSVTGIMTAATLCNDARLDPDGRPTGSATESALLAAADHEIDIPRLYRNRPRVQEIPFTSVRKRMSTAHAADDGSHIVFVKGAAEQVLESVTSLGTLDSPTLQLTQSGELFRLSDWTDRAASLAADGKRVLAIAARQRSSPTSESLSAEQDESDLTLLGLIGIQDPVRPEAAAAIQKCQSAGIQTVMITGDHAQTAQAIAQQVGLLSNHATVISGQQLASLSDQQLTAQLATVNVFARVAPEHKLRIVQAFQARDDVVAMTGDGVNDAPALKQADIGVAMGITGTDVSREASEMILADDNFATIVAAVEEGRVVYDNIRKFIAYLLTSNVGEVLLLFLAVVINLPLPLLPVQILWINLVTDGLPALALGFETAERDVMTRRPRGRRSSIFGEGLSATVMIMGTVMAVLNLIVFFLLYDARTPDATLPAARTAVFTCLSLSQLFYVLAVRSHEHCLWQLGFFSNYRLAWAIVLGSILQVLLIYVPVCQRWFHTAELDIRQLAMAVSVAAIPFLITEAIKYTRQQTKATD
ncbi:MAG: calcium-translocating P-type ATPase, PMCA-type [Planctomycetaceae bacterium]